jgi:REP element-mobilizing transposase RayT
MTPRQAWGLNKAIMPKTLGYMLTWTTYGTWLQGDERGYVKDGQVLRGDKKLICLCEKFQKGQQVKLRHNEKDIVRRAIVNEAERIGYTIEALAVCSNHIHLVARYFPEPIGQTVSRFKNVTASALRKHGRAGRVWTRGFDKRFCFKQDDLTRRIQYVKNHND